jgi:hypothetical protein
MRSKTITINTTITFMGIIYLRIFYLKHNVLQTVFCLCLQVEIIQLDLTQIKACKI